MPTLWRWRDPPQFVSLSLMNMMGVPARSRCPPSVFEAEQLLSHLEDFYFVADDVFVRRGGVRVPLIRSAPVHGLQHFWCVQFLHIFGHGLSEDLTSDPVPPFF